MTQKRHKIIIGIDEAGRGPLAGPVTAAAVIVWQTSKLKRQMSKKGLKDSKRLTPKKREEIYTLLKKHPAVEWGIGRVSEKVIDKINVFRATKLAMVRAVKSLERKINRNVDFLIIDGNFDIDLPISQESIVKGDEKVFLIKLASIVAKVTRDRAMLRCHKRYLEYRFDKHKGYGTKLHLEMLYRYGPCRIHRKSFEPVKRYCKV